MMDKNVVKVAAQGDREISIVRDFNAPRAMVYDAYTKPELLKRWLGVRDGWALAVAEVDLRVGGKYRWVWKKDAVEMAVGGEYREVVKNERLVCTERFDQAWYAGEGLNTTVFTEHGGKTTMTMTLLYESRATREQVLKSPMENGLAESYNALDALLASAK